MTSYEQPALIPPEESSPPDGPARATQLPGVAAAWLTHARDCGGTSCASWLNHAPYGSLARTFLGSLASTGAGTSEPSSATWMTSGMSKGESAAWTLNGSVSPSDASVCSLSDVLETGPHLSRYCLSPKAAAGILRRAGRRRRVIPAAIREALETVAGLAPSQLPALAAGGGAEPRRQPPGKLVVSTLQGGGRRGHRIDAEGAAFERPPRPAVRPRGRCAAAHPARVGAAPGVPRRMDGTPRRRPRAVGLGPLPAGRQLGRRTGRRVGYRPDRGL